MMPDLPFDPPYKLAIDSAAGPRWVEVLADGSQVETTPPSTTLPPAGTYADNTPRGGAAAKAPRGGAPANAQVFLNVPFAEKDEAKRLGARWDATRKKWYVPNGVDAGQFSRWTS